MSTISGAVHKAFPKTHDLNVLATEVHSTGMEQLPEPDLAAIQCSPSVRYESSDTLLTASQAHSSSLTVIGRLAEDLCQSVGQTPYQHS